MDKEISSKREIKEKLLWVRKKYQSHTSDELFLFELKVTLQDDTDVLLPVLKADKIKISDWYNDSLYVQCFNKDERLNERAISFGVVQKVAEMMENQLEVVKDQSKV